MAGRIMLSIRPTLIIHLWFPVAETAILELTSPLLVRRRSPLQSQRTLQHRPTRLSRPQSRPLLPLPIIIRAARRRRLLTLQLTNTTLRLFPLSSLPITTVLYRTIVSLSLCCSLHCNWIVFCIPRPPRTWSSLITIAS